MPEKSANIDGLEQKPPKNTTGEIHPVGEMKHLHLQRKTFKCRKFAQSLGTPMYWRQLLRRHWGARIPQRPLRRAEKAPLPPAHAGTHSAGSAAPGPGVHSAHGGSLWISAGGLETQRAEQDTGHVKENAGSNKSC